MISIIVAMTEDGVIGLQGKMPWQIKSELRYFQALTDGQICIFGRKTWESLPKKPLHNRVNLVITSSANEPGEKMLECADWDNRCYHAYYSNLYGALTKCHISWPTREIFICGGAQLYKSAIRFADRIYLTHILENYAGDTLFPCKLRDLLTNQDFVVTDEGTGETDLWDYYQFERNFGR